MNLQPILKSELVKIRPLSKEDQEELYQVAKDPKIWEQHPCKRNERAEFEKFFKESITSKGALTIIDSQTNTIIGSSRFKTIEGFQNGVEIGWTFLSRNYWGGIYNKEVKHLMMQHAFGFVDHIIFYVAENNIRSQKAVRKIGGSIAAPSEFPELPKVGPDNLTFVVNKERS